MGKKEEKIVHLTFIEHVRARPNIYGDSKQVNEFDGYAISRKGRAKFITLDTPPLITRVFKEILSNATDNYMRSKAYGIKGGAIEVSLSTSRITIKNYGKPITFEDLRIDGKDVHSVVALFGIQNTGTNFNDNERDYSGANGLGCKLTNVFSTRFEVNACNGSEGYLAIWTNGMTKLESFKRYNTSESFTEVSWDLDFKYFDTKDKRFRRKYNEEDLRHLIYICAQFSMSSRCKINVEYDEETHCFHFPSLMDYAKFLHGDINMSYGSYRKENSSIEVVVLDIEDQTQSYVNGIETKDGGTHVDVVSSEICRSILSRFKEEVKDVDKLTIRAVKPYLSFIVVAKIKAPIFTSQAKHRIENKKNEVKYESTKKLIADIYNDNWIWKQRINKDIIIKTQDDIYKKKFYKSGPNYQDANKTGPKSTIWFVEGNSATNYPKVLFGCIEGGKDYNGYYALKGKVINPHNTSIITLYKNKEVQDIIRLLGIKGEEPNRSKLRYGSVVIASDADNDGFHIRCLVINLFSILWPNLLKSGFVKYFETPILKVCKGLKTIEKFTTEREFETWVQTNSLKGYDVRYLKGLGSSSSNDIREDSKTCRVITCVYDRKAEKYIDIGFYKNDSDLRKVWITKPVAEMEIDEETNERNISNIINHDLKLFSLVNIIRSLPDCRDFLKKSYRQIIFSLLEEWNYGNTKCKGVKVTVVASIVTQKIHYAHGESSLYMAICSLVRNYTGSNNLTIAEPGGQFGTRDKNGKDCADARYLSIKPSRYMKLLFRKDLVDRIEREKVEGYTVQPTWIPCCLPFSIVNGIVGIGTGWSSKILAHRPSKICQSLVNRCNGRKFKDLTPWCNGYTGEIFKKDDYVVFRGKFKVKAKYVEVTEIPVSISFSNYRDFLNELIENKVISNYDDCCNLDKNTVSFKVYNYSGDTDDEKDVIEKLGLEKRIKTNNMTIIEKSDIPKIHVNVKEILETYYQEMIEVYSKMIAYSIESTQKEYDLVHGKYRYLKFMVDNSYTMSTKGIFKILEENNIDVDHARKSTWMDGSKKDIEKLKETMAKLQEKIDYYRETTPEIEWTIDLKELGKALAEDNL